MLHIGLLENRSGNKANPLEIHDACEEINSFLDRINIKTKLNRESEGSDDQALLISQLNSTCQNC
jgi:hypothetical protein